MARILTLQEALQIQEPLYCEFRWGIEPQKFNLKDRQRWVEQGRQYGKTWRCWDNKPEERKWE